MAESYDLTLTKMPLTGKGKSAELGTVDVRRLYTPSVRMGTWCRFSFASSEDAYITFRNSV